MQRPAGQQPSGSRHPPWPSDATPPRPAPLGRPAQTRYFTAQVTRRPSCTISRQPQQAQYCPEPPHVPRTAPGLPSGHRHVGTVWTDRLTRPSHLDITRLMAALVPLCHYQAEGRHRGRRCNQRARQDGQNPTPTRAFLKHPNPPLPSCRCPSAGPPGAQPREGNLSDNTLSF